MHRSSPPIDIQRNYGTRGYQVHMRGNPAFIGFSSDSEMQEMQIGSGYHWSINSKIQALVYFIS